jgi:hypothetical protein
MRVYLQWTRAHPQGWEVFDMTRTNDWRSLPQRDEPGPGVTGLMPYQHPEFGEVWTPDPTHPTADDPGYIYDMSVAGIEMSGADHISVDRDGARIALTRWNDDTEWLGDRYAQEFSFGMPVTDAERGVLQPDISLTVWAESAERRARYMGRYTGRPPARYPVTVYGWDQWSAPGPANMVRHGIWLPDDLVAAHEAAKTFRPTFDGWASLTGP